MRKQGATWWSSRFLRSLERLGLASRLRLGREYLKTGKVLSLEVDSGGVSSRVQGDAEYECQICFEPLTDFEWIESLERLAFQDLSAAALLTTGRLPPHIEDFFRPSGRRLLPSQTSELEFHCSCPDRVEVCKHLAATAFLFAERLDLDPWLLFLVRGRSGEQVKAVLADCWNRDQASLSAPEGSAKKTPSRGGRLKTDDVDLFWKGAPPPEDFSFAIEPSPPGLTAERMATPEPRIEVRPWQSLLTDIYATVAKRAERRREKD